MAREGGKRSGTEPPARLPKGSAKSSAHTPRAGKEVDPASRTGKAQPSVPIPTGRPSRLLDTRIIYCGDCLDQLRKLPDGCVDLIYIDPPFNSNRNYEVFWGETREKRSFEDRHASTQAYIDYMRPRCMQLARFALDQPVTMA